MAGASTDSQGRRFACKCLNIRIQHASFPPAQPEFDNDPDFIPVYSGEEGISVEHTQLTVRTRTPGQAIAESSRFFRYTTITCLICETLAYRVYQTYTADVEGKEGPLLPTEDWVERDIMKSLSGWIQVHKNCVSDEAVDRAASSGDYSSLFSVVLPPPLSPSTHAEPIFERPSSPSSISPPPPPPQFFTNLRPVFLPPPFTPSHPVFMYLSSLAAKQSEEMREAAECEMTEMRAAKTSEIEQADAALRKNVDRIWTKFRGGVSRIEKEHSKLNGQQAKSRSKERRMTKGTPSLAAPTPQTTREFSPSKEPVVFSPSSVPRTSALAQSLKTTSFHHPRAQEERATSPATNGSSSSSSSEPAVTKGVSKSLAMPPSRHKTENILGYQRNLEDNTDTAASYRYFVIQDEDTKREMKRARQQRSESARAQGSDEDQSNGASSPVGSKADDNTKQTKSKPTADKSDGNQDGAATGDSPSGSREKGKPKRKVTFDVQPEVVTIKREVNAERNQEQKTDDSAAREMIFDFEDADEASTEQSLNFNRQPQIEQPPVVARPRKSRQRERDNLSTSFSGLRPASLPAPSNIRPPRSQHGSDASSSFALTLPNANTARKDKGKAPEANSASTEEGTPISSEPSTDAANSDVADNEPIGRRIVYPEEDEEEDDDDEGDPRMFIGSMPINIKKYRPPAPLTLASYQTKSTLAERVEEEDEDEEEQVNTPKKPLSSEAIRKAEYAERDRSRSVDPGLMDFEADTVESEDDDIEGAESTDQVGELAEGGRGRKRALKILQARSEVPEEGMWRSLAS